MVVTSSLLALVHFVTCIFLAVVHAVANILLVVSHDLFFPSSSVTGVVGADVAAVLSVLIVTEVAATAVPAAFLGMDVVFAAFITLAVVIVATFVVFVAVVTVVVVAFVVVVVYSCNEPDHLVHLLRAGGVPYLNSGAEPGPEKQACDKSVLGVAVKFVCSCSF